MRGPAWHNYCLFCNDKMRPGVRKPTIWILARSDTNQAVQPLNMLEAGNFEFRLTVRRQWFWCGSYFMLIRVGISCFFLYSIASYLLHAVVDQLPRLGKRELVFLLLFTCSFVVSVSGRFLFLLVLGVRCAFLLCHFLGLPLIIKKVKGLYNPSSENKGADRVADLRLCFRISKTLVFSWRVSINAIIPSIIWLIN